MADPLVLLYRADWTQWSLSAKVIRRRNRRLSALFSDQLASDMRRRSGGMISFMGSALSASKPARGDHAPDEWAQTTECLLLAPGGQYRFEPGDGQQPTDRGYGKDEEEEDDEVRLIVSDGESCWVIRRTEAEQSVADRAHPPFSAIVKPTWLMCQLQLSTTGTTEVAGRTALQVRGTPRPPADRWALLTALVDQVDMVIDAELGLVLRYESVFDGQPFSSLELADLVINPAAAADPASFRPGDGIDVEQNDIGPPESHRYWRGGDYEPDTQIDMGRMALRMARGAVYLAARQLARPETAAPAPPDGPDQDAEAEMPAAPPAQGRRQQRRARAGRSRIPCSA